MATLSLRKLGQILVPVGVVGADVFDKLKNHGVYEAKLTQPRDPVKHRRYFALLNFAFEHWQVDEEDFKNFDVFRHNIAVLAGFYTQCYDLRGNIILEPKSISFGSMDETEFEDLYDKTIDVILKHVLRNYTKTDLEQVVLDILRFD